MKVRKTNRGFDYTSFKDEKGNVCSLQKSSSVTKDCVWLGCDEIGLQHFIPNIGWQSVELRNGGPSGEAYIANNRMHLTRSQVKNLLPYLKKFIETGELT